jgi:hypothetical protein
MSHRAFAAGAVDENASHRFGGGDEEMRAILKLRLCLVADQPQPGFVNERGGLQRMSAASFVILCAASRLSSS